MILFKERVEQGACHHHTMRKTKLFFLLSFLYNINGTAQDRHFAWSYNSPVVGKGNVDIEVWNTYSFGRKDYHYTALSQRVEFEFGVTDKIQTAFYINSKHETRGPKDTSEAIGLTKSSEFSFSNAWKFYLLNPSVNAIGLSAYAEYYLAQGEIELEGKLMVDKFTEKSRYVFNTTLEYELEFEPEADAGKIETEIEKEIKIENALGYMYHPKPNFGLGVEVLNRNAIAESNWEYSALFAGPSVFFSRNKFFFIFNVMPQFANLTGENKPLELFDQEKILSRVFIGITL